jgi:uncharacterized protein (TIGR02145 family)
MRKLLLLLILPFISQAQTIWTGPMTTFTKSNDADWTLEANQDRITDNVWITRANNQSIFNISDNTDTSSGSCIGSSPHDTEWAFGTIADGINTLTFDTFLGDSFANCGPPSVVNQNAVLHLITDDIYIDIKFVFWTSGGNGGGFSYMRSTPEGSGGSGDAGILLNGVVSAESNQIKNVAEPTDAQDAATKNYVDSAGIQGPQGEQGASGNDGEDGQGGVTTVGDGLTLTGSGTEADPYMISLPPGGTEGQVLSIINGVPAWADASNSSDADNDGYTVVQGDCDDFDASINPGATEIEDNIDNDCDGEVDEGFDIDGDGYSVGQGDCDDSDASINPGATEIEDGIDNDCDGEIDEGFNASGTVTDQDGNSYDYLTYGNQVWTVDNAEMVTYRDGTEIPQVTDPTQWSNLTTGAWAYYDNDPTKPRLYNWYAVAGIHDTDPNTPNKEFAPEGWHVPTDAEWTTLEEYLIASGYNYDGTTTGNKIGKAMASNTGWNSSTNTGAIGNDQSLNNSSDFNAFPEGNRDSNGSFYDEGNYAIFWSSTESNTNLAWYRLLVSYNSNLNSYYDTKQNGFSVRFVRD